MPAFTAEQQGAIASPAKTVRVRALAGTGKTTMLVGYATARPKARILYLAFNSSVQKEGAGRFPSHVESRTTHSMAYRAVGYQYKAKLVNTLRLQDIQRALGLGSQDYRLADQIQKLITAFTCSREAAFAAVAPSLGARHQTDVLSGAERAWAIMCDPADTRLGMTHDGYLKCYQLSSPIWSQYDIVLFDEAQDANPVTADIVFRQQAGLVLVGDSHQQIYAFRAALDAMKNVPRQGIDDFYLTQSWRFGQPIADVANRLLSWKGETHLLRGMAAGGVVGEVYRQRQHTVLARTNGGLFRAAIRNMTASLHFVGGIDSYRFEQIEDAFYLSKGQLSNIRARHIRDFETFAALSDFVSETEDPEYRVLVNLVDKYGDRLRGLLASVRARAVERPEQADIILTTAHKSKGLEWSRVILADDFPDYPELMEMRQEAPATFEAELNLIYVAATRAREQLQLPEGLFPDGY